VLDDAPGRALPAGVPRGAVAKASFLDLCHTPSLACEVTLQPIDEFGFDAAILFSDILITLPPMGLEIAFPDKGPVITNPVRDRAGDRRAWSSPIRWRACRSSSRRCADPAALAGRVPLIGFAGAPFTLVTYAVEGGGSKEYAKTKALLFGDPAAAHALLGKMAGRERLPDRADRGGRPGGAALRQLGQRAVAGRLRRVRAALGREVIARVKAHPARPACR
jgi:uroporphyrinogen-III decarboxylase